MAPHWIFTGRAQELHSVRLELTQRQSKGLVIAGRSGVGKSRLADEVLTALSPSRYSVVRVKATRATAAIPFGALADLLPLLPFGQGNVLGWAAERIASRTARGTQLILSVDDLHLLDPASASVIHLLARRRGVLVVGTLNTAGPVADHITMLWQEGVLERLELAPLPVQDISTLLAAALGGPVSWHMVQHLNTLSQGNTVLLKELTRSGLEAGVLRSELGVWVWDRHSSAINSRLSEILGGTLGRLSPQVRVLLELLALGEPLGLTLLESMTSEAALAEAEEAQLITVERSERRQEVRLAHPLYSEKIRMEMPPVRRRTRCLALAGAVHTLGARRTGDLLRTAVWQLEGGATQDPRQLAVAAQHAYALFDFPLAVELGRAALRWGGDAGIAVDLALMFASAECWDESLQVARANHPLATSDEVKAALAVAEALALSWGSGRLAEALARLVAEQSALLGPEPNVADPANAAASSVPLDELTCGRSVLQLFAGDPRSAWDTSRSLLENRETELLPIHRAHAQTVGAWAQALLRYFLYN